MATPSKVHPSVTVSPRNSRVKVLSEGMDYSTRVEPVREVTQVELAPGVYQHIPVQPSDTRDPREPKVVESRAVEVHRGVQGAPAELPIVGEAASKTRETFGGGEGASAEEQLLANTQAIVSAAPQRVRQDPGSSKVRVLSGPGAGSDNSGRPAPNQFGTRMEVIETPPDIKAMLEEKARADAEQLRLAEQEQLRLLESLDESAQRSDTLPSASDVEK
jgi:hypothetical protein